jgi:hypothetical protein
MNNKLVFEVIGGPMDGLCSLIERKGTIGRKVGNSLSLALDEEVSGRHAEIVKEGHDWCVRDLGSTNGTFHMNEKLQPNRSYPLNMADVLLVGSTILKLDRNTGKDHCASFCELTSNDPRSSYRMTSELVAVWDFLFQHMEEERTSKQTFCDVDCLFLSMMEVIGVTGDKGFVCVNQLKSPGRYQVLARWLDQAPDGKFFKSQAGTLTIAPSVWRIMSLATDRKMEKIGIGDIIGAILEDGHSLAAVHMRKDKLFMEAYRIWLQQSGSDWSTMGVVRNTQKNPVSSEVLLRTRANISDQPAHSPVILPQASPGSLDDATWKVFAQRLERLVSGFLDDAVNPVGTSRDFRPPGLERKLEEVMVTNAGDNNQLNQDVKLHLDSLYNLLVLILASQRDGYKSFSDAFCVTLEDTIRETKDGRALKLPIGKKTINVDELMDKIKTVRLRMDAEGVSENVVRDIIRKKIQKLGW